MDIESVEKIAGLDIMKTVNANFGAMHA